MEQTSKRIEYTALIRRGWEIAGKQRVFWAGIVVVMFLLNIIVSAIGGSSMDFDLQSLLQSMILTTLVSSFVYVGGIRMSLLAIDGKIVVIDDLWRSLHVLPRYILASILFNILVGIGFFALILPGLYFISKYALFGFFLVERNVGVMQAFKMSADASRGNQVGVLVMLVLCGFVAALGVLLFGVGALFTIPTAMIAAGLMYRQLAGAVAPAAASTAPETSAA